LATEWPPEQHLRARLAAWVSSSPRGLAPFVVEWQGTTYRFASRQFSDRERFTDGEGARRHGGRFTPIGGPRTVYLSLDRATATAELDSWYEYYSVPDTAFQPRLLAAVAVSVGLLLDLSAPETLADLGLTPEQVAEEWRPISDTGGVAPTQTFGRLVYEAGFEGLRFPSARRESGINLALFPDNYRGGSHALMLNSE
jgi:RES domain-containing protein